MEGFIVQLNCSDGGVPKLPINEALLGFDGLSGDRQAHLDIHGGRDRALSLYSMELIVKLQQEGHPISPGSIGENVTVSGLDWATLEPGSRLAIGAEAEVEITSYAGPCNAIAGSFANRSYDRVSQKRYPGSSRVYARVIRPGRLSVGDTIRVLTPVLQEAMFGDSDGTN